MYMSLLQSAMKFPKDLNSKTKKVHTVNHITGASVQRCCEKQLLSCSMAKSNFGKAAGL